MSSFIESRRGESGLAELPFTEAKTHLSELMNEAAHEHRVFIIDRQTDPGEVVGIRNQDLLLMLSQAFKFDLQLKFGEEEVVATIEDVGIVAGGPTMDAAVEDAANELWEYSKHYAQRVRFYEHTDRARHYPFVVRVLLTGRQHVAGMLEADSLALHGSWSEPQAGGVRDPQAIG